MRFLLRLTPLDLPRERALGTVRALAKSVGADARNPKWTSYGALELDLFCPSRADFELFLSAVRPLANLEFARDLNVAPPHKPENELFAEARDLFNEERYWECHEVLEGVWRVKEGGEKRFLQGIILVCAAFVHHQKGEDAVAFSVLGRASKQLEYSEGGYHGIDVLALQRDVSKVLGGKRFFCFRI